MKKMIGLILIASTALIGLSCSNDKGRYIDLRTGEAIQVEKDGKIGHWVNKETREPVYIYVDTKKKDTIYGKTGAVINGRIRKSGENVWWLDEDYEAEYKVKNGDYKLEVEKDGDVTIKDGDKKVKIDGETGEKKVKND